MPQSQLFSPGLYACSLQVCIEKERLHLSASSSQEAKFYTGLPRDAGVHTLSLKVRSSLWAVATSALAASTLSCTVSSSRCRSSCSSRTALALISRAAFLPSAVAISCNRRVVESELADPLNARKSHNRVHRGDRQNSCACTEML